MLSALLLFALSATPHAADVSPSCETRLEDIHDARRTLRGLHTSERLLRKQHARARSRAERNEVERTLVPIANQARALEHELEAQEHAYIRCVERQLDARARPLRTAT